MSHTTVLSEVIIKKCEEKLLNAQKNYAFVQARIMKQAKVRNWVAKNAKTSGTGQHRPKFGKFVSRARQKQLSNQKGTE